MVFGYCAQAQKDEQFWLDSIARYVDRFPDEKKSGEARWLATKISRSAGKTTIKAQYFSVATARKYGDSLLVYQAINRLALFWSDYNLDSSNHYLQQVLAAPDDPKYTVIKGLAMNNVANNLSDINDYAGAMQLLIKVENLFMKLGDSARIAMARANQAKMLIGAGDTLAALNKFIETERVYSRLNDYANHCVILASIGTIYTTSEKPDKAKEFYKKALAIAVEKELNGQAMQLYNNMASVYMELKLFDQAATQIAKAEELCNQLGAESYRPVVISTRGTYHYLQENYGVALELYEESNVLARKFGYYDLISYNLQQLVDGSELQGNYQAAFNYMKEQLAIKDSLALDQQRNKIDGLQLKHQYRLKAQRDSVIQSVRMNELKLKLQQEQELDAARNQRNLLLIGALALIIALVTFFGIRTRRSLVVQKQANEKIRQQKTVIEEKNEEIISSFNYAQRIQNAILPPGEYGYTLFEEHYVLYKPKDIVSGDFYWFDEMGPYTYAAVADCTGHGVPGAMVSVVGHNGLNKVLHEQNKIYPNEILESLNDFVSDTFSKGQDELKDGMDIALVMIDKGNSKLYYSGANNPLWIIRGDEVLVTKANKQPIGVYLKRTPFTMHEIDLEIGDQIVLFSDGYADQFGGPKGKKFKYSSLKQLMLSIHNDPLKDQVLALGDVFDSWKGSLEQIDDVCIFSYRVM